MAKTKTLSIQDFFRMFPDDDACLDHLLKVRYANRHCPNCGAETVWYRLKKEPAYACKWCGWHIHPMAGTPFARTRTPLQKWFFVMYMFTTTRNGVSAKEIQRQVSCTYKTAWRMGQELRKYMSWVDGDHPIGGPGGGIVEVDEVMLGGHDKQGHDDKTIVVGMVERGGELVTRVVRNRRGATLLPVIREHVKAGSRVATDDLRSYGMLPETEYTHGVVNHSAGEYVRGQIHTNTIEGFWSWLQRSIAGTHVWVSRRHLPKYLGEFEFRFNLRNSPYAMMDVLLAAFPKPKGVPHHAQPRSTIG